MIEKVIDSSGIEITSSPKVKTSFTYTNREFDFETGLYYYRARYYMPEIGRFIQSDPHPGKLTQPATIINKFAYVQNNPINFIDPSGEFLKKFFDDLANVINSVGDAILDVLNSEVFRIALIITVAALTGGAVATVLGSGAIQTFLGGMLGGMVGGEVGALHATMAGEGSRSAGIWRGNGKALGSIAGAWGVKNINFESSNGLSGIKNSPRLAQNFNDKINRLNRVVPGSSGVNGGYFGPNPVVPDAIPYSDFSQGLGNAASDGVNSAFSNMYNSISSAYADLEYCLTMRTCGV